MAKYRQGRIHDEAMKVLAAAFRKIQDPRVAKAFVSVTDVNITPDFKNAKIFYSHLMGDDKEVATGLNAAKGFVRHELAVNLNLRITPELMFVPDHSSEYGAHISSIMNKLTYAEPEKAEGTEDPDSTDDSASSEEAN